MDRDYPNGSIAENGQNPEKNPGDLRRLAVSRTPEKNHQLTRMWKTKGVNNNNHNKLMKCEKKDKYPGLARELKKLWNMQVTIIPIVIGAFGTVTKGLLKRLGDLEVGVRMETIQTTTLSRTARITRRVLETWGDLLLLKLQWKTIS